MSDRVGDPTGFGPEAASRSDAWLEDELRTVLADETAGLRLEVTARDLRRRIAVEDRTRRRSMALLVGLAAVLVAAVAIPVLGPILMPVIGPAAPSAAPSIPPTVPPASPAASPAPAASPGPAGWLWQQAGAGGQVVIAPDGTVVATGRDAGCELWVHAYGSSGLERPGWPFCAQEPGGQGWADSVAVDGGGTVYVSTGGEMVGIDPSGSVASSWPREGRYGAAALPAGVVVVRASPSPDTILAYAPSGADLPGWPVTVAGEIIDPILPAADGTVAVLYRDRSTGHRFVTLLGPDGAARPGWPVAVPNDMDGQSAQLQIRTADGRVVVGAHEPWPVNWPTTAERAATVPSQLVAIAPDGTIPAGWPVTVRRPVSVVAEGAGGVLYAIAGAVQYQVGGPYDVIALRPDGSALPGWPVRLPAGRTPKPADTAAAPAPWAQPPVVGADGRVVVATGAAPDERDGLTWIAPNGTVEGAYRLAKGYTLGRGGASAPSNPSLAPLLAGDRALIAVVRSGTGDEAVLAVEPAGAVEGWPLPLPSSGTIESLNLAPDGTLIVSAAAGETTLLLAADAAATGPSK
jgi:hypothetical protein